MKALRIWMLDDGVPGHWSMTEGLVREIAAVREVDATRVKVDWKWGGARQLFQRIEKLGVRMPRAVVSAAWKCEAPRGAPDLIVSRGGGTLFANAWLARETGAANVFLGTLRGMPPNLFRAVIQPREEARNPPFLSLPVSPTRIDPATLPSRAAGFSWTNSMPPADCRCLLLGGDGSGFIYQESDWHQLAEAMISRPDMRWCVASSRRTPPAAERIIGERAASVIHEACWLHQGDDRRCVDAFLGACDHLLCTADSMSMIEECITAGKPLTVLMPAKAAPPESFGNFLDWRERQGRLKRSPMNAAVRDLPAADSWRTFDPAEMRGAIAGLLDKLGL
jgi:mitochondrial fission protein ELM1